MYLTLYTVSHSKCFDTTCHLVSRVQVAEVVSVVTVARFAKEFLMCVISLKKNVSEGKWSRLDSSTCQGQRADMDCVSDLTVSCISRETEGKRMRYRESVCVTQRTHKLSIKRDQHWWLPWRCFTQKCFQMLWQSEIPYCQKKCS
jgi:hypothetical protein